MLMAVIFFVAGIGCLFVDIVAVDYGHFRWLPLAAFGFVLMGFMVFITAMGS